MAIEHLDNGANGHQSKTSTLTKNDHEDDPKLTSCGFGSWRPKFLQVFANPVFFLANLCFVGVIQGMGGSMIYSTINTIEKRYAFDSKISALIFAADNLSGLVLSPIVGYYGVRFNRARMIGFGEITLALSFIATASPYFLFGPATHLISSPSTALTSLSANKGSFEMCNVNGSDFDCSDNKYNTVWPAVYILFLANFLRGVGFTVYYVIAMPFLDDSVSKNNSPIFIAVQQSLALVGPAAGFFFSSFCLKYYEDPWNDPGLSRTDPRFVGAWWLGFLIAGIILLFAATPMLLFPAQFKGASVKATDIRKKIKQGDGSVKKSIKRFITNPMIVIYFLGNTFRYFGIGGYYMLMNKYIESQYRQSSSAASFLTGTASVLPISIGIILGGTYISCFKPRARILFTFVFLAELVSFFTIGSGIILGCDPIKLSQPGGTNSGLMGATCNQNCDCSTRVFTPICGPDSQTTFFSPCYAGCSSYNPLNATFSQCSCFEGMASKGYCPEDSNCPNLYKYLGMLMIGTFISSTAKTGNSLITFRTVDPMDKGFTNGVIGTLLSIFAFIPFPIIFGHIADSSCLVWETKCGKRGNCWIYDQSKFRNTFHGVAIAFMGIGSFFDFLLIFYAGRINNLYDDDDKENKPDDQELKPSEPNRNAIQYS